tara:strand:+ start:944 stop:1144 length:201 start_codon:yes stop_codon:yes gene_type:complete
VAGVYPAVTPDMYLYRVHWMEEGEVKRSHAQFIRMAFKHMESLLAKGIPSWMVPIPYSELDDDIPF